VIILGIGIATLDIINTVDGFPVEDSEVRAVSQRLCRGGNVTNTLVALSQFDHSCCWAGMLADDDASNWVQSDLKRFHIGMQAVVKVSDARLPTSYVTLNQQNGSRTIIHYRNLAEYSFDAFEKIDVDGYDWIHFEGRNVNQLRKMMQLLHEKGFKRFSLEVEKPREDIESLYQYPALLLFSRAYVRDRHLGSVKEFFNELRKQGITAPLYCAWGKAGGWAMDQSGQLYQQPAWRPEKVVDTLGAGDVFNAAVIDAHLRQLETPDALAFACKVAGYKCGLQGFDGIAGVLKHEH